MPSMQAIFLVALAGLGFSLSPGPSMLYVISRSLGQSRQAGLASAVGLALGGMALAVVTALGAGVILADSGALFSTVKLVGGVYLLYLGLRALIDLRTSVARRLVVERTHAPLGQVMRQGFLVEVLNPKTVLFFLAFLPQFVDEDSSRIGVQMLVLGLLIPLTAIPADLTVSFAAGSLSERMKTNPRYGASLEVLSAVILISLGLRVLWTV